MCSKNAGSIVELKRIYEENELPTFINKEHNINIKL
jgi:hypothetical protein